jgi:uncharacterized protein YjbK
MPLGIETEPETEIKLKGHYNNQLKYSHSSSGSIGKIQSILAALGVEYGKEQKCRQKDEYYDTDNFDLRKKESSLRIRTVDSASEQSLTFKEPPPDRQSTENSLRRNEHNKKVLTCTTEKEKHKEIQAFADENLDKLKMKSKAIVVVDNERSTIPIKTADDKVYSLCLDKFIFSCDDRSSDDYYEIEIESEDEKDITDKKILTLSELFVNIFSFIVNKASKYERGCCWLENQNDMKHKLFVALDVVGYSLNLPLEQKRIVKQLTLILKQVLQNYSSEQVTRLPIGDGIILVFDEKQNIITILIDILKKIQNYNGSIPADNKIYVRSALHYGDVFDCQDINDNKNFVGDGINVTARIINEAKSHQVLISDDLYKNYSANGLIDDNQFGKPFSIKDKHDNIISVRNYHNRLMNIGISI